MEPKEQTSRTVTALISIRHKNQETDWVYPINPTSIFKDLNVAKHLSYLYEVYDNVPTDKAPNNIKISPNDTKRRENC